MVTITPQTEAATDTAVQHRNAMGAFAWALIAVAILTAVRAAGLIASPVELHGDEAQYWGWAQSLDWGYYSKPPLIAWTIAASTTLFGDSEWAIRLISPFAHGLAALFLGLAARDLYGPRAGAGAAILYTVMPAVWLSSGIVSTDALLLALWSGALFAFVRFRATGALGWAIAAGVAAGLGFLAKYAMIYFALGAALATLLDAPTRRAVLSFKGLAMVAIAVGIVAPNLAWNAANAFATVSHTADNANWTGPRFRPHKLGEFWQEQLAVFGPFTLLLLGTAVLHTAVQTPQRRRTALVLLVFIVPALLIISGQAFINRAHANWAAAAYAAGTVLLAGWLFGPGGAWARRAGMRGALLSIVFGLGIGVNVVGGGILAAAGMSPTLADGPLCTPGFFPGERACAGQGFKRVRGSRDTAAAVRGHLSAPREGRSYAAVLIDNRLVFHAMEYYLRADPPPLAMWMKCAAPKSHAEERAPLGTVAPAAGGDAPVLILSTRPGDHDFIAADFARLTPLGTEDIDLGAAGVRRLWFFAGEGYAPQAARSGRRGCGEAS